VTTYNWRGHRIDVEFKAVAGFLWLGGAFIVNVDGRPFFPDPNELSTKTRTLFFILDEGQVYPGVVMSAGVVWVPRVQYVVMVGTEEVARDRQLMKGWHLNMVAWMLFALITLLALVGVLAVYHTYFRG
jgi:hypothetical protein